MNQDERDIRNVIDTWMSATKAGDVSAVMALMTNDVVFLVPGREPFGKQEFKRAAAITQGIEFDGSSEVEELNVRGDWAYLRTRLRVVARPRDGRTAIVRSGHTLTIMRKGSDGRWRVARDANLLTTAS